MRLGFGALLLAIVVIALGGCGGGDEKGGAVLQADGPPSSTFGAEFGRLLQTVYEAASSR